MDNVVAGSILPLNTDTTKSKPYLVPRRASVHIINQHLGHASQPAKGIPTPSIFVRKIPNLTNQISSICGLQL
ncbi:hypothetical protein NC652_037053 [Populus alba x Populus x berolinensis]|nr:hypothetical protein NC652_037053 [Populus alba x Populus x berolinensis]